MLIPCHYQTYFLRSSNNVFLISQFLPHCIVCKANFINQLFFLLFFFPFHFLPKQFNLKLLGGAEQGKHQTGDCGCTVASRLKNWVEPRQKEDPSTRLCALGDSPSLCGRVLAPRDLGEASFSLGFLELRVYVVEAAYQQFSDLE